MQPQKVTADDRIKADLGSVALTYGPLVYNVERADHQNIDQPLSDAPLKAEWRPDFLGGVMVLAGTWKDGSPMLAVPNYARMNRVGPPREYLNDPDIDYAPGATTSHGGTTASSNQNTAAPATPVILTPGAGAGDLAADAARVKQGAHIASKVWI